MLELALNKYNKKVKVLDIEQTEEFIGIYYTLQKLGNPYYIIGTDLLYTLPVWKKAEELISENKFYVIERENYKLDIINNDELLYKNKTNFIISNYMLRCWNFNGKSKTLNKFGIINCLLQYFISDRSFVTSFVA